MASQTQSQTHHRRNPAGQGIVVRPVVGKSECRYCHEEGHHISRWNRQTKTKELTCPKLIAKEERKQQRMQRGGNRRQFQGTSTMTLGGWVAKAEISSQKQRRFARHSKPIRSAPLVVNNRFDALATMGGGGARRGEAAGPKSAPIVAPTGAWGAVGKLHVSIAVVVEREEEATALGLVAESIRIEQEEEAVGKLVALPKVVKKVRFAGDSENLEKPPCIEKIFRKEDPPIVVSSDEEKEEKLVVGKNAWRPKSRSSPPNKEKEFLTGIIAQKEAALEELKEEGMWGDCDEQETLAASIHMLKKQLAAM